MNMYVRSMKFLKLKKNVKLKFSLNFSFVSFLKNNMVIKWTADKSTQREENSNE